MAWRIRRGEIVLGLQGGIGNQLFEWAFASALRASGRRVLFDAVRCRGDRPLMIGPLLPAGDRLAAPVGLALVGATRAGMLSDRSRLRLVRQRRSGYDSSVIERLGGTSYLLGYFQSGHYFAGVEHDVREAVRALLEGMLTPSGRELAAQLRADPHRVAVHVRRGDYVSNPTAAAYHGTCSPAYYRDAVDHIAQRCGPLTLFVFSDDQDWVRANMPFAHPAVHVDCNPPDRGVWDMHLMKHCRHHVVANSSFSWWGAWLNPAPDKIVVAPRRWFTDPSKDTSDLVPAAWTRI